MYFKQDRDWKSYPMENENIELNEFIDYAKEMDNSKHFEYIKDAINKFKIKYEYTEEDLYADGGEVEDWMEEALESLIEQTGIDDLEITMVSNSGNEFFASNDNEDYRVFKSEHDAEITAENEVREMLEDSPENFDKNFIVNYIDGRDYFQDALMEMNYSYAYNIQSEDDNKYANRLISEMVDYGLLDEEDAQSGNADELADYYTEDFVNLLTNEQLEQGDNGLAYFIDNFGEKETLKMAIENNLIDIYEASKDAVESDGIGHFLTNNDEEMLYLSDGYVAFRNN